MIQKRFSFKMFFGLLFFALFLALTTSPAQAYDYGNWTYDGYIKSQFGLFTEGKPFNKAEYGGSNDNIATARQQFRFNLNGQISKTIGVRAEVLAAWEPDYPHDKGTENGGYGHIPANFYSSFDWRELTIEYKPTYSHTIRFGRQIVNWGEAISGRVVDQCNPVDSRYLLGFTNLEETYVPLWMFRGIHDFWNWNTTIEWIFAPIWRPDRYEVTRAMTSSGQRLGDGTTGTPWYRFAPNPEGRVYKMGGADMVISASSRRATRIYGPPFDTMYHGSDILGASSISPLSTSNAGSALAYIAYASGAIGAGDIPTYSGIFAADLGATYPNSNSYLIATERPTTDGSVDSRYGVDYPDHNFKNSRWGFKTKHMLWGAEVGLSFFQGPGHSGNYHYRYKNGSYLIFEKVYPRYNTYGLFGNYQFSWGILQFEGAYKPDREYHKPLFGVITHEGRLNNVVEKDYIHTLLGVTREQMIPFLNEFTPFTIRTQWQAWWYLQDMDDVAEIVTYFNESPQLNNEFLLSISTSYSYRKYSPSLTFIMNPRGQLYSSASFTYVPDGFNTRLSISAGYTNIWGANDYSARTVLAAKNDLAVVTVKYSFY